MAEKNILIADDDERIQKMIVELLRDEGYRFFLASNGKEAVEIAGNNPIDLAVLDMVMPQMSGAEALKRIKAIDNTIGALIITGHTELGLLKETLFDHGALDYLLKPFDMVELKLTIRRALHNRELVLRNDFVKKELENRILELERAFKEKTFRLRESQIKYRNIVENSTDAIVVIQDGYLKFANKKTMELSGYSREEILNTPFTEMIHPDDRAIALERYGNLLQGEDQTPIHTFRIFKKDGHVLWAENHTVRIIWEERPATLNFIRDISQRMRDQEALRIKDFAIGSSINGIAFADLEGNLTYVNDSFLKIWGYDDEKEVLGRRFETFWRNADDALGVVQLLRDKGGWVGELTAVKKDGLLLNIQICASMVTDRANRPVSMMASFVDITKQKRIEEVMVRSEKLASLGQLSAGLAHELRNPLAVISSCSQFCLDNMELERRLRENFQVIYRNSRRASRLISELLAFAKPGRLERKEVDVNEVVTRMWRMAELEINTSHVTFVPRLEKRLPRIMGDEEKLGQVFLNLIQNAIQAVSGKGRIVLETRCLTQDDLVEVNIIDDGPGIPEDYRNRIFDPFFTTKDRGTGLGLSICHSTVKQHQGSISVQCGGELGTQVSVRLPVKQDETKGA